MHHGFLRSYEELTESTDFPGTVRICKRSTVIPMDHPYEIDSGDDEFEPLFDYSRSCQPPPSDDSDGEIAITDQRDWQDTSKRRKIAVNVKANNMDSVKVIPVQILEKEEEEEDWLPPPPEISRSAVEARLLSDPTLTQLRQKREELLSLTATSAEAALQKIEEEAKLEALTTSKQDDESNTEKLEGSQREKVIVSIQNKSGSKPFRVFMDEKFEKLFRSYARSVGCEMETLVFCFDGQPIAGSSTPEQLGIENEDIIEAMEKR